MTCVWDGILRGLDLNDFKKIGHNHKPNALNFVKILKSLNKKADKIISVNNEKVTEQQKQENFNAINNFNEQTIFSGYLCSTFDPFLMLICDLFNISIKHKYQGHLIEYKIDNPTKIIGLSSDMGHLSFNYVSGQSNNSNIFDQVNSITQHTNNISNSIELYGGFRENSPQNIQTNITNPLKNRQNYVRSNPIHNIKNSTIIQNQNINQNGNYVQTNPKTNLSGQRRPSLYKNMQQLTDSAIMATQNTVNEAPRLVKNVVHRPVNQEIVRNPRQSRVINNTVRPNRINQGLMRQMHILNKRNQR